MRAMQSVTSRLQGLDREKVTPTLRMSTNEVPDLRVRDLRANPQVERRVSPPTTWERMAGDGA